MEKSWHRRRLVIRPNGYHFESQMTRMTKIYPSKMCHPAVLRKWSDIPRPVWCRSLPPMVHPAPELLCAVNEIHAIPTSSSLHGNPATKNPAAWHLCKSANASLPGLEQGLLGYSVVLPHPEHRIPTTFPSKQKTSPRQIHLHNLI